MIDMNATYWMVRAGRGACLIPDFLSRGFVTLGWSSAGDLTGALTREAIRQRVFAGKPGRANSAVGRITGSLHRFRNGIKLGHQVVTYNSNMRIYHIGLVVGDYEFSMDSGDPLAHRHAVQWTGQIMRDELGEESRKPLNALQSIFEVPPSALVAS